MTTRARNRREGHIQARCGPSDEARETYFAAARAVVVRDGVRGLTIKAIAKDAGLTQGTVGTVRIDEYLDHIVDYVFTELVVFLDNETWEYSVDYTIWNGIDRLFDQQPDLPILVLQASALAAAERKNQRNGVRPGEIRYIKDTVSQAKKVIGEILADKARVDAKLMPETIRNAIKTYFERAFLRAML